MFLRVGETQDYDPRSGEAVVDRRSAGDEVILRRFTSLQTAFEFLREQSRDLDFNSIPAQLYCYSTQYSCSTQWSSAEN